VDVNNPNYASQDGILYNKAKTNFIHIPRRTSGSVTIPAGVKSIAEWAFAGCGITSITIPTGVTSIGDGVFFDCNDLADITIPASVTSIGGSAFNGCSDLTSIIIPANVTSIGSWVFNLCTGLTSVTFGGSTITSTDFGYNAFPEGINGEGGDTLKTAYLVGGAGTYTRDANGSTWTKQSGSSDIPVSFSSLSANGSSTQTTTQLTLTFGQTISGLSANDISLSGVTGVIKGTLSGSGPTYTLPINGFTTGGTLNVAVSKSGYAISNSSRSTTIYYYNFSNQTPVATDYTIGNLNQTAGNVTVVTITAKPGKSPGAVSNIRYNNSTTIPQTAGSYTVTFNVEAATGWNAASGLSAGTLMVNAVLPTVSVSENRFEYYWVNEHDSLVTTSGGVTTVLQGQTLTITPQGTGYDVRQWHLDGFNTGQSRDTYVFSTEAIGKHIVGFIVEKDGKFYNTNITITVDVVVYTVTFNINSGSGTVPAAQTVTARSSITLPSGSGLSRSGYTFGGWNTNTSGTGITYDTSSSYTPTGSITLYAKWNYTVTFNANSGSGTVPAAQTVTARSSITLPSGSGLTRPNYIFSGWNTNASGTGTNYSAGASYTPASNVTLYARWITSYIVTFDINYGSGTAPAAQTVAAGSSITLPSGSGMLRTGYAFGGWNINTSGTGTNYSTGASYTPTGNITLFAGWVPTVPPGMIIIDMYDNWGDGWGGALRINVNGVDIDNNVKVHTTAADNTPSGQTSTNTYTFYVATGDVVQLYWVPGGSSSNGYSFIVYYTDTPPSPAFTTSNNTSWSGTNALVYRLHGSWFSTTNSELFGSFMVQ